MTCDLPPAAIELGLGPDDDWRDQIVRYGCGCEQPAGVDHDEEACLEEQADALAEAEDARHSGSWEK